MPLAAAQSAGAHRAARLGSQAGPIAWWRGANTRVVRMTTVKMLWARTPEVVTLGAEMQSAEMLEAVARWAGTLSAGTLRAAAPEVAVHQNDSGPAGAQTG